jgi:hypothetical protein
MAIDVNLYSIVPPAISKQELLDDLRRVGEKLKKTPSAQEYKKYGQYSDSCVYRHFDGFVEAREEAGFEDGDLRSRPRGISREKLINAIQSLRTELGRVPRREEMRQLGEYSEEPFRRVFGTWGDAVIEAGYEPYRPNADNAERKIYTCEYCGLKREALVSQNKRQNNWFCSESCKNDWQAENVVGESHHQYKRVSTQCSWCEEPMSVIPSVFANRTNMFCNTNCAGKWYSKYRVGDRSPGYDGGRVEVTCQACGDIYEVRKARVGVTRFCSYECLGRARITEYRGENNPNYNPDSTDKTGPNWLEQRRKRIKKDNASCVACGMNMREHKEKYGFELDIHHVLPRYLFNGPDGLDYESANKVSNLRTMCRACHRRWEGIPLSPSQI